MWNVDREEEVCLYTLLPDLLHYTQHIYGMRF